ncbi:unnamed protein product [Bemisia tabaci]|uniref:BHLH domain-containing protein n=1 Tax=Bemisia tabaci TaxID=7038 RepID=A0A9P0EZK7_BEMTA|nr:PREDICTED: achaete-scute homolog 1a-like [Bemisia tabaci]XP_018917112.1 PREDICTED: achaete-scute homolog 1a-like [Bemisia tabaci]CAH0382477.1 unnamed protein product [Bemisia tabaci]
MASVIGKPIGLINLSANNAGLKRLHNGTAVIVTSPSQVSPIPVTQIKTEDRGTVLVTNNNNTNIANNNPNTGSELLRCKRRINFAYSNMANHQPASVARRNARERNRVKQVNNGFATLRSHIPVQGSYNQNSSSRSSNKKLSKVETLRMAVEYIRSLQELLDGNTHPSSRDQSYYPEDSFKLESMSPTCSENSSSPPPSSYTSEGSYNTPAYAPMSPEDEDLLDVISLWQQSQ